MKNIIWISLLTLLLAVSCGEPKEVVKSQVTDPQIQSLVQDADEMAFLIDTNRILRSASTRDRMQIRGTIERVKTAAVLLDENPNNLTALMSLKTAFKFFENIVITERDQPRLDQVLDKARKLMATYANIQNVNVDDVRWALFSYRFSSEITPFGSSDVPNKWGLQFVQQERYAVRARGENTRAVLLSPTFDLTNVSNPGFQLRHSFQVEEHFIPRDAFNRSKIMQTAFQMLVSTEYKDGDDFDSVEWKRVDLGKLPLGLNFNTVDSGIVDLRQFEGKKVTMAMVYRNNDDLNNHILSWSIERFELYGVSDDFNFKKRPIPFDPDSQDGLGTKIWNHNFNSVQLGDLQQVTLEGAPGQFIASEHRGTKFVKMQEQGVLGTKLLYSAPVDLGENLFPHIRVAHTINFYTDPFQKTNDVKMVVAKDVAGVDVKDLDWKRISFEKNNPTGGDWDVYKSEWFPIPSELLGKKIRVGWMHTARGESTPVWQIHGTWINNVPELVK